MLFWCCAIVCDTGPTWTLTFKCYSTGIDFSCQNLTSVDVRFWRLKSTPALRELKYSQWPQSLHNGIQMNRKELTETFMMISNWKNLFDLHDLYTNISALWRLNQDWVKIWCCLGSEYTLWYLRTLTDMRSVNLLSQVTYRVSNSYSSHTCYGSQN